MVRSLNRLWDVGFLLLFPLALNQVFMALAKLEPDAFTFFIGPPLVIAALYLGFFLLVMGRINRLFRSDDRVIYKALLIFGGIGILLIIFKYIQGVATCEAINLGMVTATFYLFVAVHLAIQMYYTSKESLMILLLPSGVLSIALLLLVGGYWLELINLPGWQDVPAKGGVWWCSYWPFLMIS